MDSGSNLDTLMARYQAGDFAAVTALVECIGPQLHRFFMAQSASRSDADDLLQETWLRIHRVRHTYRPGRTGAALVLRDCAPRAHRPLPQGEPHHRARAPTGGSVRCGGHAAAGR